VNVSQLHSVPDTVIKKARELVAKRVNIEARQFYLSGQGDDTSPIQACMEAILTERARCADIAERPSILSSGKEGERRAAAIAVAIRAGVA
jgi:hypothetical protein